MRFIFHVVDCEPEKVFVNMPVKVARDHLSERLVFPRWAPA
jgi:hypothetical protein